MMKNKVVKILVLILFILQIIILLLYFNALKDILKTNSFINEIISNQGFYNLLFLLTFIISGMCVLIILTKLQSNTGLKQKDENMVLVRESAESKTKGIQEQKNLQAIQEKKKQMISELLKNLQTQTSLENFADQVLINISKQMEIFQGIIFVKSQVDGVFRKAGTYAYFTRDEIPEFSEGIGLTGQVAESKKFLNLDSIPERYLTVMSGLGKSEPTNLIILPVILNQQSIGIIELASFKKFDSFIEQVLSEFSIQLGQMITNLNKPS